MFAVATSFERMLRHTREMREEKIPEKRKEKQERKGKENGEADESFDDNSSSSFGFDLEVFV